MGVFNLHLLGSLCTLPMVLGLLETAPTASSTESWWVQFGALGAFTAYLLWNGEKRQKDMEERQRKHEQEMEGDLKSVLDDYRKREDHLLEVLDRNSATISAMVERAVCPYAQETRRPPNG